QNRATVMATPCLPPKYGGIHAGNSSFHAGNSSFHAGNGSFHAGNGRFHPGNGNFHAGSGRLPAGSGSLPAGHGSFVGSSSMMHPPRGYSTPQGGFVKKQVMAIPHVT
ncbi:MAG: hypothetical protein SGPRY_009825, partial [Prymnesium sp.]